MSKEEKKGTQEWEVAAAVAPPAEDEWGTSPAPSLPPLIIEQYGGNFNPEEVKMLVYGESGSGKSRFASTWPEVIFADSDKGMGSVTEKVARVPIDNYHDLENFYTFLQKGEHPHKTVILDTLNENQLLAMDATIADFPMVKRAYNDLASMSDYGKMLSDFMGLTRKFIALPMIVILLAQVDSQNFETDMRMPQLVGKKTARDIARKMDVIGYMYKSDQEDAGGHKLSEMAFDSPQFVTKDRSFKLPSVLPDPNYARMATCWQT